MEDRNKGAWLGGYDHYKAEFKDKTVEELRAALRKLEPALSGVCHRFPRAHIFGIGKKIAITTLIREKEAKRGNEVEQTKM